MLMVALAWQMYDLTGRAWDLGLVGFIYALGAAAVYGVCVVLFIVSFVFVGTIARARPPESKEPVTITTLLAGFGFIWHKKPVLGAISLDLFAVLLGGATALLPM